MNLQESIRRILREEELRKMKTDKFQKLIDDEIESMKEICKQMGADDEEIISFDACDFLDLDPKVVVTDVDKFYGKLRILVVIKYEAAMHFHDEEAFIYELQSRLKWVGNVMIDVEDVITTYPNDKNSGNMNLQESIRRILREEDYSPAGKEITPNNIVIHKSNPVWRENILKTGLQVSAGECYKTYVGYGVKCKPAIFATNSTNKRAWFDSTYDDDIWEINTEMIPDVKWYKDRHFESRSKHIVTFQDIPKEALTLKYEGTGSGDVEKWDKDSPNIVRESIKKVLREENKKSSLLSSIEENGLYDIIANTGLHVNEVEQKVGQLSREVLERFIKDVVKEHFQVIDDDGKTYIIYLEDYPYDVVPIGNNDYVDQLRVTNNELFILVTLYEEDEYGDLEEQSYEIVSPKNLLYANIYEIAGQLGFLLSKGSI